jgi:cytidylate kinase
VAQRLGWELVDHHILDKEVEKTGIEMPWMLQHDERAPGLVEAWSHPQEQRRYFEALQQTMREYASLGRMVIVGRGGNCILRDEDALHLHLMADMPFRVQRVMEIRWVNEGPAREIIARSDRDRQAFYHHYFHCNWGDPLRYHATLNTGQLGVDAAIEMIVGLAGQMLRTG